MIRVALANLRKYNEGTLDYDWLELPIVSVKPILKHFGDDEFFICDYECEEFHIEINEYENLEKLNDFAKKLDELTEDKLKEAKAIVESEYCDVFEIFEVLESENYVFYEEQDLEDFAIRLVDEGSFGKISEELIGYLDYERIADDLRLEGYIETSFGVIAFD